MSIRIIVDSTADMRSEVREKVTVVPLNVRFGDEEYLDGVELDYVKFYEKLESCDVLPSTSQPSPATFQEIFDEVTGAGDEAIVITISSKLSGTYQCARLMADDYDNIFVVDSKSATIGAGILVEYALELVETGMAAKELADRVEAEAERVRIVAVLDTLEFLKRGGRISTATAIAGNLLSVKPLISVQNGIVNMIAKVRGQKLGFKQIGLETEKMGEVDWSKPIMLGHTGVSPENLEKYEKSYGDTWKKDGKDYGVSALGSVIGTHVGPGATAVAFFIK